MTAKNFFSFGGVSSATKGLTIEHHDILGGGEPDLKGYEIPGRDGTFFVDNKRRRNVLVSYNTFLQVPEQEDLSRYTGDLKRWLLGRPGVYRRLEDSYDKDHFRLAVYASGLKIDNEIKRFTKQTIEFSCLPYRYRKAGDNELSIIPGESVELVNDTGFDALPVFRLFVSGGSGSAGGKEIEVRNEEVGYLYHKVIISGISGTHEIVVDSQEKTMIFIVTGISSDGRLDDFPILPPGKNVIRITGSWTGAATVKPRWREL